MSDDTEHERDRIAEEAVRAAREAEERAERIAAEAQTPESQVEGLRQSGVIYGALILIALYMVQPFLVAPTLDVSATISVIAFAVAIPLLAALAMINRQETYRGRRAGSVTVNVALSIAQGAALVGIVAGFWHITWVAGVTFLVAAIVGMGVHSAGWWRVESTRSPSPGSP
jgi:cation transport ATPase